MPVTVANETPLQDDVRHLIAGLNTRLLPILPIAFQFKMTVEQMAAPDTTVFVAREDAGGAVLDYPDSGYSAFFEMAL